MRSFLFFLILPILAFQAWGWDIPTPAPLIDQVKLLTPQENAELTQRIQRLSDEDGIVLSVVILQTLDGQAIEDASIKMAEKFQLGKKKEGNGLLLLIATGDRKMRIEVGQGIEDIITDAQSNRLIRRVLAPTFSQGQYAQGLSLFVTGIHNLKATGKIEGTGEEQQRFFVKRKAHVSPIQMKLSMVFIVGLLILLPVLSILSSVNRKGSALVGALGFTVCGGLAFGWASILLVFIIFPLIGLVMGLVGPHNILAALMTNAMHGGGGGFGGYGGGSGGGGSSSSWGSDGGGFSGGGSSGSW